MFFQQYGFLENVYFMILRKTSLIPFWDKAWIWIHEKMLSTGNPHWTILYILVFSSNIEILINGCPFLHQSQIHSCIMFNNAALLAMLKRFLKVNLVMPFISTHGP